MRDCLYYGDFPKIYGEDDFPTGINLGKELLKFSQELWLFLMRQDVSPRCVTWNQFQCLAEESGVSLNKALDTWQQLEECCY